MRYLLVCFVLFALTQCSTPPQTTVNPLGFIPAKPIAILHTEDMESLVEFSNSQPQLSRFLAPLVSVEEHWLSFQECIVSYREEGVEEYKYLLIRPLATIDSVPAICGVLRGTTTLEIVNAISHLSPLVLKFYLYKINVLVLHKIIQCFFHTMFSNCI